MKNVNLMLGIHIGGAMNRLLFLGTCLCLTATVAVAAQPGEEFTRPLGFELESITTLGDVQKKLGPAELTETGDAGGFLATVCYVMPDSKTVLSFESGELGGGGPNPYLEGFSMRVLSGAPPAACFPLAAAVAKKLNLSVGGLYLGMSKKEFKKVLGKTTVNDEGALEQVFERREKLSHKEIKQLHSVGVLHPYLGDLDVLITVDGKFEGNKLVYLSIWKVKTN